MAPAEFTLAVGATSVVVALLGLVHEQIAHLAPLLGPLALHARGRAGVRRPSGRSGWRLALEQPPQQAHELRAPLTFPLQTTSPLQERVVAPLLSDGTDRTVPAEHQEVVRLAHQLFPDARQERLAVAVGEVVAADRAGEE